MSTTFTHGTAVILSMWGTLSQDVATLLASQCCVWGGVWLSYCSRSPPRAGQRKFNGIQTQTKSSEGNPASLCGLINRQSLRDLGCRRRCSQINCVVFTFSRFSLLSPCVVSFADDRSQLVILRDPRAVAVSSYYHRKNGNVLGGEFSLEEYLPQILPGICMWTSIRYVLFAGLLDNSNIFWYDETVARPRDWHRAFLNSVGLHVPSSVVEGAVAAALRGEFSFTAKTMDRHSEQDSGEVVFNRSWKDDLEPNVILELDSVLRMWLPPVLLAKLGIALAAK